ncbi:ATP-binding protein [Marispirochaeta aestuarii]|uniref:sensor histidine kinase n=1 Tax=Marispirochaeta aestuarii TaxID=1963862 RepID=UPI002ABD5C4E|nr:ATP-binding protein [Marispirochaeta aestuarii]
MKIRPYTFRWFIFWLIISSSIITLLISGTIIFLLRQSTFAAENMERARQESKILVRRTEGLLAGIEESIGILTQASLRMDTEDFADLLQAVLPQHESIRVIYFLDRNGQTYAVHAKDHRNPLHEDFIGIDFSYSSLYSALQNSNQSVWSDKFISVLSGDTSVGVGIRLENHTAIAEISLEALLSTVEIAAESSVRLWVVDKRGELIVDTDNEFSTGITNVLGNRAIQRVLDSQQLPVTVTVNGKNYYPAADISEKLGWIFMNLIPAGLDNRYIRNTLIDIIFLSISYLVLALLLSPLWSYRLNTQVMHLMQQSQKIAEGHHYTPQKNWMIREFHELSESQKIMADKIFDREKSLIRLNQKLEDRVQERTRALENSNRELQETLENMNRMQEMLIQTEKQAALGRLVAGVAHELNTPIGNAIMSISSLKAETRELGREVSSGLRRFTLERFLRHCDEGLDIAERNVSRAAELINSFKHVANDQTSSVRRKFFLDTMIHDVLLTMNPMIRHSRHRMETDLEQEIEMDSYPGSLGQIITNLITNALAHAWDDDDRGSIWIKAGRISEAPGEGIPMVQISVQDNGKGIPAEIRKKIFDPFFTTRLGRGGTGLGLNIAYNSTRNILGGTLNCESTEGEGTVFKLKIPVVAPLLQG